jgi:hypothetical protein
MTRAPHIRWASDCRVRGFNKVETLRANGAAKKSSGPLTFLWHCGLQSRFLLAFLFILVLFIYYKRSISLLLIF